MFRNGMEYIYIYIVRYYQIIKDKTIIHLPIIMNA